MRLGKGRLGARFARSRYPQGDAPAKRLIAASQETSSRAQLAAVLLDLGLALRRFAVRLRVDLALPGPQTASRKCVGPSLNEACMARPSIVVPNTDFQK